MNTKTTLILAVFAAAAAGYVFWEKPWEASESSTVAETPKTTAKPLFDPKPTGVDRVEMTARNGKFIFAKQDNTWQMLEPMPALANEFEVNALVDKAADVKYLRAYEKDQKDRPSPAVSGLDKPQTTVKLFKSDKLAAELVIGDRLPTGKGSYVARGGSDQVYETQADFGDAFDKRVDAMRDKRVLKFELKDVKRVKVEGLQNYELAHSGEDWIVESPTRSRGDKERVERVVRPLTTLSAQDFKDDKPVSLRPYGLDRPRLKVTMATTRQVPARFQPGDAAATRPTDTQPSTEEKTYVLLVGGATDNSGNAFFAKLEGSPAVFTLQQYTVNELSPQVAELRDKTLAKIEGIASVTRIEGETPGGSYVLTRSDKGEWHFADGGQADAAAVDDLVRAVQNLRASDFASPSDPLLNFDWKKPRAKIAITRKGELAPVTLLVGQPSASGKMAYARNATEDATAIVREEEVEALLSGPVAYQDRAVVKFPQDRVTKLEIAKAGQASVVLSRANNQWTMTAPVSGTVDAEAARNIVQDLSSLRAKRVVDGDKAKYGLDAPTVKLAVWAQSPAAAPNAKIVGAATQPASTQPATQASTRPAGKKPTLEELLAYQKTLPNANPLATKMLEELIAKEKAEAATRPAAATQPSAGTAAATKPALEDYLARQKSDPKANPKMTQALEQMVAEQKGGTTQPASTQPAAPPPPVIYRLALTQKNGVTYAALDDKPTVYELDNKVYEDATAEMHDRQIVKFEVNNVTDVAFESGENKIILRKSGEEWKYMPDPVLPIDKQKVTDVLNAFRDLKTHRFVSYTADDLAKYGLDKPAEKFSVTTDAGKTTEVLLSTSGPDADPDKSRYASVAGTKQVFLLKTDQAVKFAQKLEDFEKKAGAQPSPQPQMGAPTAFGEPE